MTILSKTLQWHFILTLLFLSKHFWWDGSHKKRRETQKQTTQFAAHESVLFYQGSSNQTSGNTSHLLILDNYIFNNKLTITPREFNDLTYC